VLVAGLRAGDEALVARVLDTWSGGMLRLARAFVSTPDSAAEVVQDAWLGRRARPASRTRSAPAPGSRRC